MYESFEENGFIYIIMEYCEGGDLEKYLSKVPKCTEDEVKDFLYSLIPGFEYLRD